MRWNAVEHQEKDQQRKIGRSWIGSCARDERNSHLARLYRIAGAEMQPTLSFTSRSSWRYARAEQRLHVLAMLLEAVRAAIHNPKSET